jgi:putative oxidoreductase
MTTISAQAPETSTLFHLTWLQGLLHTSSDSILTVARWTLGLVILPHGLQKTVGWFGGYGFSSTMSFFTQQMEIPAVLALLAILAESAGAVALLVGALTRVAAFGIGVVMAAATATVHVGNGFFMNWSGTQAGEGFEYHLLAGGLAAILMLRGGGRWSADRFIRTRLR